MYRPLLALAVAATVLAGCASDNANHDSTSASPNEDKQTAAAESKTAPSASQASFKMSPLPATERAFIMDSANAGLAEIELSKLATDRAADPKVKEFARQMVTDHTRINQQVADLASKYDLQLAGRLTPKDMKNKSELEALSGKEFDERYVADQIKDHQTVVGRFETQARQGQDPALKSFAESTLPTLRQHLEHAQSLANKQNADKPQ